MTANPHQLSLEPAAQEFVESTDAPPYLFQLPVAEGRAAVEEVQSGPIELPEVDERWITVDGSVAGPVEVRIVRPAGAEGLLPVIVYVHGAGWVFGDAHTHDRLVRDLVVGTGAAVVFPDYERSPEARFPVALEQCYEAMAWAAFNGGDEGLDGTRLAVAGDSVGGNMAIGLTQLARRRHGIPIRAQVLFYPVTDAAFETGSYHQFAEGYFLRRDGMQWFWDQYASETQRADPLASPLRTPPDDLVGLPPALVITAEADVLRDEGEAYAARLRDAGVPTVAARYGGIIHDFVMLNALRGTEAARAAIAQANAYLAEALR